jgi:hypothetical protein
MLSSVLKSSRAVQMNIVVMRAFVRLREVLAGNQELAHRLERVEATQAQHGSVIRVVVEEIRKLKQPPPPSPKPRIGFLPDER